MIKHDAETAAGGALDLYDELLNAGLAAHVTLSDEPGQAPFNVWVDTRSRGQVVFFFPGPDARFTCSHRIKGLRDGRSVPITDSTVMRVIDQLKAWA